MKIEIKCCFNAGILFECEAESLKCAMQMAVQKNTYLRGADLRGADLRDANLEGADLGDANLQEIKDDYFTILEIAKNEVKDLYKALIEGRINGSVYTGECACLVGTIANIRKEPHDALSIDLSPNNSRPAEKWFLAIRQGDTPSNNPVAAIVKYWTEEFMRENGINIPKIKTTWEE